MPSQQDATRIDSIRAVVNELIVRRAAGEIVTDESMIEQHPQLMPELAEELQHLKLVESAERGAQSINEGLHVRCPHCQNPMELVDDSSLSDVLCSSCGSQFNLTDDSDRTFQARQHEMVNHFQLLDRIGVGAFGSVWSARDTQLDRIVAIKIPRKGQLSNEETEQFIREARAAAQLKHPNIVSVLEVGRYKDRIYIACDYIQGMDLADWLTDQQATPTEAADLCVTMADALQHAHNHGVIHRDLKPSNIMLDSAGEPHLMDFGLAKRESGEMTMTVEGKLLGTPAYMSPEQARGAAHDADARSDVYSLGVILFELLTGTRPFRGSTRMLLHQVLVDDAPNPRKLNSQIPKDLETICLKCLEKSPDRRYADAAALRDDLKLYLEDKPIKARRISGFEKLRRWRRRNPMVATLGMALGAVLVFLAIAGPLAAWRQSTLARETRLRLYRSDIDSAYGALADNDFDTVRNLLDEHLPQSGERDYRDFAWFYLEKFLRELEDQPQLPHDGRIHGLEFLKDGTLLTSGGAGINQWDINKREPIRQIVEERLNSASSNLAVSSDGRLIATCNSRGAQVLRLSDGNLVGNNIELDDIRPLRARFSPDDQSLVLAGRKGMLGIFDLMSGQWRQFPVVNNDLYFTSEFSPDGKLLATSAGDRVLRLWDVATGEEIYNQQLPRIASTIQFSPDGQFLFHNGLASAVARLDLGTKVTTRLFECPDPILAISKDGTLIAAVGGDRTVRIWNRKQKRMVNSFVGHTSTAMAVAFSHDGHKLATGSQKGNVRLWDIAANAGIDSAGEQEVETSLAISTKHGILAIGWGAMGKNAGEGGMHSWDLETLNSRDLPVDFGLAGHVFSLAISPDDRLVAVGGGRRHQDGQVKAWNIKRDHLSLELSSFWGAVHAIAFSPRDQLLAAAGRSETNTIKLLDSETGKIEHEFAHLPKLHHGSLIPDIYSLRFSPNGEMLAAGGGRYDAEKGIVRLWNVHRRTVSDTFHVDGGRVHDLEFFSDGNRIAISHDGKVTLYDVSTRQMTQLPVSGATSLAISPDNATLAIGTEYSGVRLWHMEASGQVGVLSVPHRVTDLAFMPDGKSLIAACDNKSVWIWMTSQDDSGRSNVVMLNPDGAPSPVRPGHELVTRSQPFQFIRSIAGSR